MEYIILAIAAFCLCIVAVQTFRKALDEPFGFNVGNLIICILAGLAGPLGVAGSILIILISLFHICMYNGTVTKFLKKKLF